MFLHFFDIHFLEEKGVTLGDRAAQTEMAIALRLAVLTCDKVYVPAASYFENPICRQLCEPFMDPELGDLIVLVGSNTNVQEFVDDKRPQYDEESFQGTVYRSIDLYVPLPWHARVRSTTGDIVTDWRRLFVSAECENLFRRMTYDDLPAAADSIFPELPERLDGKAFLVDHARPILFGEKAITRKTINVLHTVLNEAYFRSYAIDLGASVFQEMKRLGFSRSVPSGNPDRDLDFSRAHRILLTHGVLADVINLPPAELFAAERENPRMIKALAEIEEEVKQRAMSANTPRIAIITALKHEAAAVTKILSEPQDAAVSGDPIAYEIGSIQHGSGKTIPVLHASIYGMGTTDAAIVATNLKRSYPSIRYVLMVGIAGACPNPNDAEKHVRLGDLVISTHVVQHDLGALKDGVLEARDTPQRVGMEFRQAMGLLGRDAILKQIPWAEEIGRLGVMFQRPTDEDVLKVKGRKVKHPQDSRRVGLSPVIHEGVIASGNIVVKDEVRRDAIRETFNARAIEMEGSAVHRAMSLLDSHALIIRGTCDYCTIEKGDDWQYHAAALAAVYAKKLIVRFPREWISPISP
jgi:nucleoside phosphorylase